MRTKHRYVTREELFAYLEDYPNELDFNCITIGDPPVAYYHDWSIGDVWHENRVAGYLMEWLGPNGEKEQYKEQYWKYFIIEEDDSPQKESTPVLDVQPPKPILSYAVNLTPAAWRTK